MEKYRLGNTGKSYELKTDYLEYVPARFKSWNDWYFDLAEDKKGTLLLVNKEGASVEIAIVSIINKESFSMSVCRERRFDNWFRFMIISLANSAEPFIIPMHAKDEKK